MNQNQNIEQRNWRYCKNIDGYTIYPLTHNENVVVPDSFNGIPITEIGEKAFFENFILKYT